MRLFRGNADRATRLANHGMQGLYRGPAPTAVPSTVTAPVEEVGGPHSQGAPGVGPLCAVEPELHTLVPLIETDVVPDWRRGFRPSRHDARALASSFPNHREGVSHA